MNRFLIQEGLNFYRNLPKNNLIINYKMPSHYGSSSRMMNSPRKAQKVKDLKSLSDVEYYKEHSKHHSAKHIKAMKDLQKLGVGREKAHLFVKKYMGK